MVAREIDRNRMVILSKGQTDVRSSFDLSVSGEANLVPAPAYGGAEHRRRGCSGEKSARRSGPGCVVRRAAGSAANKMV